MNALELCRRSHLNILGSHMVTLGKRCDFKMNPTYTYEFYFSYIGLKHTGQTCFTSNIKYGIFGVQERKSSLLGFKIFMPLLCNQNLPLMSNALS